jgi:phosphatidylinositol glycan class M
VILPSSTLEFKWKGLLMILIGFGGELFWLFWAFHLEMKGKNTFLQIWIAGLFFFLINVGLLVILMRHQLVKSLFQQEKITFI